VRGTGARLELPRSGPCLTLPFRTGASWQVSASPSSNINDSAARPYAFPDTSAPISGECGGVLDGAASDSYSCAALGRSPSRHR
jgi:hypothetical protein